MAIEGEEKVARGLAGCVERKIDAIRQAGSLPEEIGETENGRKRKCEREVC